MYIPSLGFASSIMHSGNGVMYYPNSLLILVYTVCYVCLQISMGCLRYKEFQILESVMWSRPTRTLFNGGNLYICCVGLTSPYCMLLFFLWLFPLQMRVCYPVSNNLAILGFYTSFESLCSNPSYKVSPPGGLFIAGFYCRALRPLERLVSKIVRTLTLGLHYPFLVAFLSTSKWIISFACWLYSYIPQIINTCIEKMFPQIPFVLRLSGIQGYCTDPHCFQENFQLVFCSFVFPCSLWLKAFETLPDTLISFFILVNELQRRMKDSGAGSTC